MDIDVVEKLTWYFSKLLIPAKDLFALVDGYFLLRGMLLGSITIGLEWRMTSEFMDTRGCVWMLAKTHLTKFLVMTKTLVFVWIGANNLARQ